MQYSQEHLKTMVYSEFGGQTECIMGNSKIENSVRNLRFRSSYCAKVGAKAKNKTKQNRTKQKNHSFFLLSPTFSTNWRWNACHIISHKSKVHLNRIIRCCRKPVICVQVLISSLTIHNFHLYCFEKGFDLILFITSTFPRHTFGQISHFRNVRKLLRLVPTVELPLKANQGHPTSIFEKYLFGRRFEF